MINARRRLVARLLLPIVAVWLTVMPYREARAILPLAVPIGVALVDAAGAVLMADATVAAGSAVLGGIAMAAILLTPGDSPVENGQVRVPLSTATGSTAAMTAMAPVAAPTVPVIPAPYSQAAYDATSCGRSGDYGATVGTIESCSACFVNYQPLTGGRSCKVTSDSGGSSPPLGTVFDTDQTSVAALDYRDGCDVGYSLVSGSCVVSNVRAAVPDNKADYQRTGTTIAPYSGDDTPTKIKGAVSSTSAANDTVSAVGTDADGNPRQVSVQAVSTGGSLITTRTQRVDANGNSYVENKIVQVSAAGAVNAVSTTSTAQRLEYNATTGTMTVTAAPTSTYAPAAAGTGAGSEPIVFPSDYARAGEAASAAQSISNTLGPKIDAITNTGDDPVDPLLPEESIFNDAFFSGTFNNLLGWQLPAHSSECPTGSFAWNGGTYAIDSHCQLINSHFGTLSAAMAVVWTVAALFLLLRA